MADAVANTARSVAATMHTVGWCYAGVKRSLRAVGVNLWGGAAWQAKNQLEDNKHFHVVNGTCLRPGDILVHGKSRTHPYGHIAVYLGHGEEASDHLQHLIVGGTYGKTVVFRPDGSHAGKNVDAVYYTRQRIANGSFKHPSHFTALNTKRPVVASEPSKPAQPAEPPVDPKELADARQKAQLFVSLYKEGAVSRLEAQAKLEDLYSLESRAHVSHSDQLALN